MDGSTDARNMEEEIAMIQYCVQNHVAEEISSCSRFLSVVTPKSTDAKGLIDYLSTSLHSLGVDDVTDQTIVLSTDTVVVGVSTDGASVNIGERNGMKAQLQRNLPWLLWQ